MSNLVKHAEEEMRRAGLYDADADYDGMIPKAVMKLVEAHASEGHSGGSHSLVIAIFNKVINFKPLTPLSTDPAEWQRVDPDHYQPGTWQSRRQPEIFSRDGGKTHYDIDDDKTFRSCVGCKTHFPTKHAWFGPVTKRCCSLKCANKVRRKKK